MGKLRIPILMWLLFEAIAVTLWLVLGNVFFLFNFSYIGTCLAAGLALYGSKPRLGRHVVELAVGLYMLVYLGFLSGENMQIEGFWYYLFLGTFQAAVIHYVVAKILGPMLFGRGWCGWCCWTAMVLDLLPYKTPQAPRRGFGWIRYLVFAGSLVLVGGMFLLGAPGMDAIMAWLFVIGNVAYYVAGIVLALVLKDNRAFCKYLCPVTVFLKPMSSHALLRVKVDADKCVSCGACKAVCPMDVDPSDPSLGPKDRSECILCMECIERCPKKALHL